MQKAVGMLTFFLSFMSYAADVTSGLSLDKVTFQLSAKQWIDTKTALLSVSINMTLNNADLVKARMDIVEKLGKIAKSDWHLTRFERSQDNSGLEKLTAQAEARVDQTLLTHVYQNAKAVSKPGAHYEISSIEFKPGFDEIQQVQSELRLNLYQQVQAELGRINTQYPEQHYTLYNLTLLTEDAPRPRPETREFIKAAAMPVTAPSLTVSHEIIMTADVQLAANRKLGS